MLRTCLTTHQNSGIRVRSCFPRLLETINNTSLTKHQNNKWSVQSGGGRQVDDLEKPPLLEERLH